MYGNSSWLQFLTLTICSFSRNWDSSHQAGVSVRCWRVCATAASGFSFLTGEEPDVVSCCCKPFTLRWLCSFWEDFLLTIAVKSGFLTNHCPFCQVQPCLTSLLCPRSSTWNALLTGYLFFLASFWVQTVVSVMSEIIRSACLVSTPLPEFYSPFWCLMQTCSWLIIQYDCMNT